MKDGGSIFQWVFGKKEESKPIKNKEQLSEQAKLDKISNILDKKDKETLERYKNVIQQIKNISDVNKSTLLKMIEDEINIKSK